MNKTRHSNQIYETKGVYGDGEKFVNGTSDRLGKMIEIVKNLTKAPKNVLDVGCGTGYFAHLTKKTYPNAKVYGVDISNAALSIGKKKYKDIIFVKADAEVKLPFKDNTFDLVISGEHIEHVRDIDQNLLEINRVMRTGGTLIITTPNLVSAFNRLLVLMGKWPFYFEASLLKTIPMFKFMKFTFPNIDLLPSGHLRLFTPEMLVKLLKIYCFKKVYGQGLSYLSKPVVRQFDKLFSLNTKLASGLLLIFIKEKSLSEDAKNWG